MDNSKYFFFNKDGYPHNFTYNQDSESWNGKIIFDENSDQTFKTQSLYMFESVDPIDFTISANLVSMNYNNNSGMTISGLSKSGDTSYQNEIITNILEVNSSNEFYSKWIYGIDFHKKFPVGTVVSFSGVTGTTNSSDFSDDKYFNVLSVKKNAFLIITNTSNDIFNYIFLSGTTSALNMISINDYNRNLLSNTSLIQNLYTGKIFSLINTTYNDGIVSVMKSGITTSYLNEIKLDNEIDKIFTLSIELFTERPTILQNNITLNSLSYDTGTLNVGKYAYLLQPTTIYTESGIEQSKMNVIFEDTLGNQLFSGYTFTIDSLVTENILGTKKLTFKIYSDISNVKYRSYSVISNTTQWNTIQFDETLNIKIGDIIHLSGITSDTGTTCLMNNREFSVIDVIYNTNSNTTMLFVSGYIINEDNSTYIITQKLQSNQIKNVNFTSSGDITTFNNITLNNAYCYSTSNILNLSQNYISGNTNNISYDTINSFINKYKTILNRYGIDTYYSTRNNNDYLSIESLYGASSNYFSASGYSNDIKIDDNFDLTNNGTTIKYDIVTNETLIYEKTNKSDLNLYKPDAHSEIVLRLQSDNDRFGFNLNLNGNEYSIGFSIDSQTTINNFISTYYNTMYSNGYTIYSGYSINYTGYTLNIQSDNDIWDLGIIINILSTYEIIENQRNNAILLSGNELITTTNLFDLNLATGMLLKITGSTYDVNNKEYNILYLSESAITLSYQGVFTTEYNAIIGGTTREFIRKPRGEYDNIDVYLKAYWEIPYQDKIDETIFFYDISGDQLVPFNNIENLKYTGQKPLIDLTNNVVFLNNTPNTNISYVNNPKYQQTVFTGLTYKLEQLDSSLASNYIPEPLEIFIGYNSPEEGVNTRTLKIDKIITSLNSTDYFSLSGYTNSGYSHSLNNFILSGNVINFATTFDFNFKNYFEVDQLITIDFQDQNNQNQTINENINIYKISDLTRNKIFIDTGYTYANDSSGYTYDDSGFTYFNTTGSTFYYKIQIQPKELLSCILYAQTEIEDTRFKVNLNNVGVQLEDDAYEILYLSDIEDNAIDYTLFNKKRKEMLINYREVYDYIGSYKALINAINFFGYNDLYLSEYYRNIDKSSTLYGSLHKILIPDIFDNSVPGWTETDFISSKYQNNISWKKTNLFNLSYSITDIDGNNVLIYSLDEVQTKLTKLKTWLRRYIVPLSTNLVDITGVSDTNQTLYQNYDESNQVKKSVVNRNSSVVNFNYTATLNFGSDYLITVNFYTLLGSTGTTINNNEIPNEFSAKIKTFYLSGTTFINPTETLIPVQYFKLHKNDLSSFSFSLNENVDPYIYIETTTYDNNGSGIGYVNNKLFYYDEPRNYWIVNNNFDLTKMKYWQTTDYITNTEEYWDNSTSTFNDSSTTVSSPVETIVQVNSLNQTYISKITPN